MDAPQDLESFLTHRYFVRFHMGLMLGGVILSGVWASALLRRAGLLHPAFRYPLAVVVSYLVFFALIRLWLLYIDRTSPDGEASGRSRGIDLSGVGNGGSFSWGGSSGSSSSSGSLAGRGGGFGGGGASTGFEDGPIAPQPIVVPVSDSAAAPLRASGSTSAGHSGRSGGGGGGGDGLGILIALAVLVAVVCGAGIYLVYQAPVILSEAAFHAALLPGLVKVARGAHDESWERSLLGSTWIPFALVLVLAAVLGGVIRHNCPEASTLSQALSQCVG